MLAYKQHSVGNWGSVFQILLILGFPNFGIQVIMPSLLDSENCPISHELLIALVTKTPISFKKKT